MASNVFNTFSEKCGSPTEFAAQAKKRLNEIIKKITPGELALYEAAVIANHEGTRTFLARIDEMAHWRQFPLVVVCDYKGALPLDELRKVRSNVNKANFSILEAGSICSFLNHNPDKELLKVMGEVEAAREVLGEERTSALPATRNRSRR